MPALYGPSRLATSGRADSVLVMLHGVGSNGDDLMGLAPLLADGLPNTAFHAPDAPHEFEEGMTGYQWYSRRSLDSRVSGVIAAAPILDRYVDELAEGYGLPPSRCALLGFSQGCIVALHAAPRRAETVAGVVGLSGALITGDALPEEVVSHPPVLLVHGEEDVVLPAEGTRRAGEALGALGIPVETHVLPNLGHAVDRRVVDLTLLFLQRVLA
ncbi:MAG: dienelactone hydrolase family protein [Chloroflexota bacterium]|nr:dienelactone hydrolase family protein [Chloroflexota bacterium]